MDKNFNDEELSDIMKEIEALEEDFSGSDSIETSPVLKELAEMSEEEAVPSKSKIVAMSPVSQPAHEARPSPSTSMSFKVHGSMTLEMLFEIGGKCVTLEVTESGLNIGMDGGVKFTVPVSDSSSLKKVA